MSGGEYIRFNTTLLALTSELCNVYPTHQPFQTFLKQLTMVAQASVQTPLTEFRKGLAECDEQLVSEDDSFFLSCNNAFLNTLRLDVIWPHATVGVKRAVWAYLHKLAYICKSVREEEATGLMNVLESVKESVANGEVDPATLEAVAAGTGTQEQQLEGMRSIMVMAKKFML